MHTYILPFLPDAGYLFVQQIDDCRPGEGSQDIIVNFDSGHLHQFHIPDENGHSSNSFMVGFRGGSLPAGCFMSGSHYIIDIPEQHNKCGQPFPGEERTLHSIIYTQCFGVSDNHHNVDRSDDVYEQENREEEGETCVDGGVGGFFDEEVFLSLEECQV